jgi:benzoate/toluate 1,2-dioxygenase subunit alpha
MADRSPEGELEIAGGVLRYLHDCNWKMFVENLNDTMHPMVAHESSAGTAKRLWADQPPTRPSRWRSSSSCRSRRDYKFFDDMGVRVFDNGHSYTGVNFSIHSKYSSVPATRTAMRAYGEERAHADPGHGAAQHRLLPEPDDQGRDPGDPRRRPLAPGPHADRVLDLPAQGRARRLLQRTVMYSRLINSPMSVVGHDDLHATARSRRACTRTATNG